MVGCCYYLLLLLFLLLSLSLLLLLVLLSGLQRQDFRVNRGLAEILMMSKRRKLLESEWALPRWKDVGGSVA